VYKADFTLDTTFVDKKRIRAWTQTTLLVSTFKAYEAITSLCHKVTSEPIDELFPTKGAKVYGLHRNDIEGLAKWLTELENPLLDKGRDCE
jgi:hypothetical protein